MKTTEPPAVARTPARAVIAGASGLIGRALVAALVSAGWRVTRLVRRPTTAVDEARWNPAAGELDPAVFDGAAAVVNLAGENVGAGRWTTARRTAIRRSRIDATRTLVAAMRRAAGAPATLVCASAVGVYGDCGDAVLTEASATGTGFLTDVCREWEAEAREAENAGSRCCRLRLGVVLSADGGMLPRVLPLFRLGLGGPIGDGTQWMSWISRDDVVGAIRLAMVDPACRGAVNATSPEPVTNEEFVRTLGRTLRRPARLRVPAWALRLRFGEMADGTVLASTRAVPQRLLAAGYTFRHPTLAEALEAELGGGAAPAARPGRAGRISR